MIKFNRVGVVKIAALFFAASSMLMDACQVPVFRYALERWPADPYGLAVFHNGPLTKEQEAVVASVDYDVNLEIFTIDASKMTAPQIARFGKVKISEGQLLARLYYPWESGRSESLWEGGLTREMLSRIVNSPVRRRIAKDILAGESAVWVILQSGEIESDNKIEELLNKHLKEISQWLEIPEGVAGPGELERVATGEVAMEDVLRSTIPLKISFSVVKVSMDDPDEEIFIRMLTGFVPELMEEHPGQPLVFPVFGRGRALDGIAAKMLNEELMASAGSYICGACSCEVKRENPGIDLVMSVQWDDLLEGSAVVIDKLLPPLEGVGDLVAVLPPEFPVAVTVNPAADSKADEPAGKSVSLLSVIGVLCGVLVTILIGLTFLMKRRSS
ncbi:MAG: hypothetical protein VCA55_10775 [Verrucomicrobiales bacterium]